MEEIKTGVETNVAGAPAQQQGVENNSAGAPADDPEARIAALIEKNKVLERDRDNYRNGLLAVKGKNVNVEDIDLTDPIQLQAYINKAVGEKLLESRATESSKELEDAAIELARKNKELATAVANRNQVSATGTGAGAGVTGQEVKTQFWSPEQEAEMRARWKRMGHSDERINEMVKAAEQTARRTQ